MPSPFPGMNPFLEEKSQWTGLHNKFLTHIEYALNPILPVPYIANTEVRCYIERPNDRISDLAIRDDPVKKMARRETGVALLADPALKVRLYSEEERREAFVNILDMKRGQRIVTTIELLSLTNKTTRDKGRRIYLKKQQQALNSHVNLVEIDLLRGGKHTVAIPRDMIFPEHPFDYIVCLHRADAGDEFEVWPNRMRERLPRFRIPLDPGVPDVVLDLQVILDALYDAGYYQDKIDYEDEPEPPLKPEDAAWADALLREKGLRTG